MGGSATRVYNVAKGLVANDVKVTVVAGLPHYPTGNIPKNYRGKPLVIENIGKIRVIRTFVPPLASKGFANRFILSISFAVSSTFGLFFTGKLNGVFASYPNILSIFPALVYKCLNWCPIILDVNDLWPEAIEDVGVLESGFFRRLAGFIAKIAYLSADNITLISSSYTDTITGKYHIRRNKVTVVPAGVDLDTFSFTPQPVPDGMFKVLYVGAFSPAYNFEQILKAAKLLEGEVKIRIFLQGGGEMASNLAKEIGEMGLSNVMLTEKIVPREEVAKLMAGADALLLPLSGLENVEKGLSSKLYEYQASGRPIICCSSGESGRYVQRTKSGIVIRPGDHRALAKAVLYIYKNRERGDSLGRNGRKAVEQGLTLSNIGSNVKDILERK